MLKSNFVSMVSHEFRTPLGIIRGSNVRTRLGAGLGLLLVQRCAELHGAQVRVESKVGDGTTVTVRLAVFPKEP